MNTPQIYMYTQCSFYIHVNVLISTYEQGLNPGVGNCPVITYAHLSQVDRVA